MIEIDETISDLHKKLKILGFELESENVGKQCGLLDQLLKHLIEEKGRTSSKLEIAIFIEEESDKLLCSVTDVELVISTFKNVFQIAQNENSAVIQGQSLVSITTTLLQMWEKFGGRELSCMLSEHLDFLWNLVNQVNNTRNVYARTVAATCLLEMESFFPGILKDSMDSIYTVTVMENSVAHQQYMALLSLIIRNTLTDSTSLSMKQRLFPELTDSALEEACSPKLTPSELNQVMSFLLDQLHLTTAQGAVYISTQIIDIMLSQENLQTSIQILKPLMLNHMHTFSLPVFHVVVHLEKNLGHKIFEFADHESHVQNLLSNSNHPALPASVRLVFLGWLQDYLSRNTRLSATIGRVDCLFPSCFDGAETQQKKLILLSSMLKHKKGKTPMVLLQAVEMLQRRAKYASSVRTKSAVLRVLYRYLLDHKNDMEQEIPRILVAMTLGEISFTPFVLYFLDCISSLYPTSQLPSTILSMLVCALTQPHMEVTHVNFHYVLQIFQRASKQESEICQPKEILSYLHQQLSSEELVNSLSWLVGHQILSLCYEFMKQYDTGSFFYELSEVLKTFMFFCDDVDVQDRAKMYHVLLACFSNKKVKEVLRAPKQSLTGMMANETTFQLTSSIKKLNKPLLKLSKTGRMSEVSVSSEEKCERLLPNKILESYKKLLTNNTALRKVHVKFSLDYVKDADEKLQCIRALALFFNVPKAWGAISPVMMGHLFKGKTDHTVELQCEPIKPYPVQVQVSAEFGIHNMCHVCSLEDVTIEFPDFFCQLPVADEYADVSAAWRKEVFHGLWNSFNGDSNSNPGYQSVHVIHKAGESVASDIRHKLVDFFINGDTTEDEFHIGIFLPPSNHLLLKFYIREDCTTVKIATDDIFVLAFTNEFLKQWC